MKCSICEKEAIGFVVTKTSGNMSYNVPKIIEARCKEHLKLQMKKEEDTQVLNFIKWG